MKREISKEQKSIASVEERKVEAVDDNIMKPRIETLTEKKIIGKRMIMSLADNKISILWQSFMPRRGEITNNLTTEMISKGKRLYKFVKGNSQFHIL